MYKSFISNLRLILPCVATSLGLTLLPICPAIVQQTITWPIQIRKLPCRVWLYLRVEYRLFPLRQLVGLFRCRFGLTRPVLALQSDLPPHAPSILSLLAGIASARPSAFVSGAGIEPASRVQQLTLLAYTRLLALPSELPALVSTCRGIVILGFY